MTKKDKILKLFNETHWNENAYINIYGEKLRTKSISYDGFRNAGLAPTVEYQEKYCDVLYAAQVIRKMGYKVLIGIAFHVYERTNLNKN